MVRISKGNASHIATVVQSPLTYFSNLSLVNCLRALSSSDSCWDDLDRSVWISRD